MFVIAVAACAAVVLWLYFGSASAQELSPKQYERAVQELNDAVDRGDPAAALTILQTRAAKSGSYARSCHSLSHAIGHAAFKKYENFGTAMEYQDEFCNSGYLHGVIESDFLFSKDIQKTMQEICAAYPAGKFKAWECFHGVGHGVMYYTSNELPVAIKMCDTYTDGFARDSCMNGIFMENFNTERTLHPSKFLMSSDPFFPCDQQQERDRSVCYMYAPTYYLILHKDAYKEALSWCLTAPEPMRLTCAMGVGAQTIKEHILDPVFAESVCAGGTEEQVKPCLRGMAGIMVNHFGAIAPAKAMCEQLQEDHRQTCNAAADSMGYLFR